MFCDKSKVKNQQVSDRSPIEPNNPGIRFAANFN